MAANQPFLFTMSSFLFMTVFLQYLFQTCDAICTPFACGIISNISYPFRLKDDPNHCGDRRFKLACENNVTSINLNSHKYYIKEINYHNSTIRLVDASINDDDSCSFPSSSAYAYNFTYLEEGHPYDNYTYLIGRYQYRITSPHRSSYDDVAWPIHLMSCPTPLKNSSLFTDISHDCASVNSSHPRFTYIKVGHMNAFEVPETCRVDLMVMTSWKFKNLSNVSLLEIHHSLLYGFELIFCSSKSCMPFSYTILEIFENFLFGGPWILVFIVGLLFAMVSPPVTTIIGVTAVAGLCYLVVHRLFQIIYGAIPTSAAPLLVIELVIEFIILVPRFIIFPLALCFFIYKFRRRNLSIYNTIESFLQSDNKLVPIKYSYSDIKKMTRSFQDKLGEGGYGSVYKGKLRSGHDVAVKMLIKSGANDQDFMNEIGTIGRIHHVNIVQLVGYCAQGTKRALVFDFMPNGSLEKYLFNREKMNSLNWNTKFEIAIGIAKGIEYLHLGCDIQILHFDIKPHNILLDDKFVPKITDFGLAKMCSTDKNTITMTTARGTIGYVAPELINRGIGAISYKADVYSFGMLLMEVVSLNRHMTRNTCDSSQYFPNWIYDCFNQGRDIEIETADQNDNNDSTRKLARKIAIVALWCIQMNPDDRPPMNKVLKMLEGDVELLHIPNYPSLTSTQIDINVDQTETMCSIDSLPLLCHVDLSSSVEITVEE